MTITIIDETGGLLALFPEFFDVIWAQSKRVVFPAGELYRPLLNAARRKFPQTELVTGREQATGESDLTVYAIKDLRSVSQAESDVLYFPIFTQDERLPEDFAPNVVPLDSGREVLGHRAGHLVSLRDLIVKRRVPQSLTGKRVLVSAGPTAEDLDPVRYLTNRSSGKMGVALAQAAFLRGAEVELVLGATTLEAPPHLNAIRVRSAQQMAQAVFARFPQCHVYLGAAAVADYTPARIREHKIKKNNNGLTLELKRTTDIIKKLGEMKIRQFIVGFSVETESVIAHSVQKMQTKNMDMIVVNNPLEKGAGFATDTNRVTMIDRDGGREDLPLLSKLEVADRILEKVARMISVKDGKNRKTS